MQKQDAARALLRLGADANAFEAQKYDIVTIAAVADDVPMLKLALAGGGSAKNITSPYEGTALIAASHLGHDEVVRLLIAAQAPLDHVNNLGWTALIESIVLGNGGKRHIATLDALVKAGADVNRADRGGSDAADAGARAQLCRDGDDPARRRRALTLPVSLRRDMLGAANLLRQWEPWP